MLSALQALRYKKPSASEIQTDLLAGLTIGIIALPLSMALAIASGVPPQHGLYTAIVAGIVIALTGGSAVNISGPTAAFVVVLLPIVQQFGIGGLLVSGFMAGIILIALGVAKLGKLIEVVPYPVVIGFTAGIAVVIATLQIKDFLGLTVAASNGHYVEKVSAIISALPTLNGVDTLIGVVTLTILILWPRLRSRIPGHLIAVLVGSLIAFTLQQFHPDLVAATIGSRFSYELNGINGS
ncbi:MAG: C4-dicarboxylic acid transporter DauA, partial [Gammaproteobacteria bacterium]|nr:C4-dicarboxylic acid transporter DauA [Gammaproteobacteria bacterium]